MHRSHTRIHSWSIWMRKLVHEIVTAIVIKIRLVWTMVHSWCWLRMVMLGMWIGILQDKWWGMHEESPLQLQFLTGMCKAGNCLNFVCRPSKTHQIHFLLVFAAHFGELQPFDSSSFDTSKHDAFVFSAARFVCSLLSNPNHKKTRWLGDPFWSIMLVMLQVVLSSPHLGNVRFFGRDDSCWGPWCGLNSMYYILGTCKSLHVDGQRQSIYRFCLNNSGHIWWLDSNLSKT